MPGHGVWVPEKTQRHQPAVYAHEEEYNLLGVGFRQEEQLVPIRLAHFTGFAFFGIVDALGWCFPALVKGFLPSVYFPLRPPVREKQRALST